MKRPISEVEPPSLIDLVLILHPAQNHFSIQTNRLDDTQRLQMDPSHWLALRL